MQVSGMNYTLFVQSFEHIRFRVDCVFARVNFYVRKALTKIIGERNKNFPSDAMIDKLKFIYITHKF